MPPHYPVSDEIIDTYRREGAVKVPGAFRDWVPRMLAAHDRIEREMEPFAKPAPPRGVLAERGGEGDAPPLTYRNSRNGSFAVRNAVFHDPVFRDWMENSPVASIVGQVISAKHLRFWWDQSFCKDDSSPGGTTEWHTDSGAFSFLGDHLPSVWIAGTDVPRNNAPLLTAVGSHHDKRWFRPSFGKEHVAQNPENYYERSEIRRIVSDPATEVRVWECDAGDLLVIHPYAYHASLPCEPGAGRRIAFTSRWLGDDIVWNKREMTFEYPDDGRFKNIAQGKPPPDDGFPIIWRAERALAA